ncbi:Uncharacterized protein conserved in bacteria (DUF2330) [Seminavis robusta]|uniref:Uncharacterized protein conserved in bacteria (DUF2330) n=1 Tax=Seminavis robusta TaxID=568900 RepID=A0A9N8HSQ6_9STRA|nr:Uncharacterized protein conserved in bacteria (DUF2330) [Seminavis robusta]|eukprot:Sro1550_g281740.1 Uncharacterized protein conserved in bacteria (DUF2330) (606) ;mRNA; f:22133-23950
MHVQIFYEGPAEGFSWVLPVPYQPQIDVGSDRIFTALFQTTLPTFSLQIQQEVTDTCSQDAFQGEQTCAPAMAFFDSAGAGGCPNCSAAGAAVVLDEGNVGPFDYVIIEAADNDPSSVFRWLEENNYDQPDEAAALLNYYAMNDHKFVALRLEKDAEAGEIQPLIMTYEMPAQQDPSPIACVPIQLTRIAATENMPIQVYVLGDVRATPLNFMEMELDDAQVPWLNCQNRPTCFDDNYRERFNRAANELLNHTFVTEYAGPASIAAGRIEIPVDAADIASVQNEQEFFDRYFFSLPNTMPLVVTIINEHTTFNRLEPKDESWVFNATLLAQELEEKVLEPAREDQAYVDSFAYLTRMYARLGPSQMTKDPFFTFKAELPEVDRVHRATALPVCTSDIPSALEITVERGGSTITIPASYDACSGQWNPATDVIIVQGVSPARQLASWGYDGDEGIVVVRSDNGTFDMQLVQEAVAFGDSLVMSQEIPEYTNGSGKGTTDSNTTLIAPTPISSPAPDTSVTSAPSATTSSGPGDSPAPGNIFNTSAGAPTSSPDNSSSPGAAPANGTVAPSAMPTMAPSLRSSAYSKSEAKQWILGVATLQLLMAML